MDSDLYPRPQNTPENHAPEYDAYTLRYPDGQRAAVRATIGVEVRGGDATDDLTQLQGLFALENGPLVLERGRIVASRKQKKPQAAQELFFAYWSNADSYDAWVSLDAVRDFFENEEALKTDIGRWRETGRISLKHHETSYSHDVTLTGASKLPGVSRHKTNLCGYWGAARDRIPASADSPLDAYGELSSNANKSTLGAYVKAEAGGNFCTIRTSQDWIGSPQAHADWYRNEVEPVLHAGVSFLAENPEDCGTLGTRYIREADVEGNTLDRTCALVYFESLEALEKWTHTHPTHLAIFKSGVDMVMRFGGDLGVRLFHEVTVFPEGCFDAEYTNCSADVGLLERITA